MTHGYRDIIGWEEYEFDCPEGTWTGRLDQKAWGNSTNLMLYFTDQATSRKYWFSVWHRNAYNPRNGGLDFKREAEPGDLFELTTKKTKNGNPNLITARKITLAEIAQQQDGPPEGYFPE